MEAVEVVRQAIEAYEAGGIEALARFYHPEAEIVGGPFMGLKGNLSWRPGRPSEHDGGGP
jgi:hypothetical protein